MGMGISEFRDKIMERVFTTLRVLLLTWSFSFTSYSCLIIHVGLDLLLFCLEKRFHSSCVGFSSVYTVPYEEVPNLYSYFLIVLLAYKELGFIVTFFRQKLYPPPACLYTNRNLF